MEDSFDLDGDLLPSVFHLTAIGCDNLALTTFSSLVDITIIIIVVIVACLCECAKLHILKMDNLNSKLQHCIQGKIW